MSTFGKKALNHWDYNLTDTKRWNLTPKAHQKALLEKWYPVGMKCHLVHKIGNLPDYTQLWEIVGYTEMIWGWVLSIKKDESEYIYDKHPLLVVQTKEDIRNKKLDKLI